VEFEARAEFLNPVGTIQGGILTAMLDDTVGPAASFLRPARRGNCTARAASSIAGVTWCSWDGWRTAAGG
jgi:acyl-coenzyme A thioesterase PaaI-like protein